MLSVGIRSLRQRASELLRRVAAGERIEITDRGRPVALLTPVPPGGPLDRLREQGEVEQAIGDLDELPPPLDPDKGSPRPSTVLARLRRAER